MEKTNSNRLVSTVCFQTNQKSKRALKWLLQSAFESQNFESQMWWAALFTPPGMASLQQSTANPVRFQHINPHPMCTLTFTVLLTADLRSKPRQKQPESCCQMGIPRFNWFKRCGAQSRCCIYIPHVAAFLVWRQVLCELALTAPGLLSLPKALQRP